MSTIPSLSNLLLPTSSLSSSGSTLNTGSTSGSSSSSSASGTNTTGGLGLTPQDFIQLMVTQLENQDPTQPMSNEDLLQQMSEIGQLESTDTLQTSLTAMTLQNQIGSASNMIGKQVAGLDDSSNNVQGIVNSVQVQNSLVYLTLDTGASLQLGNVTAVAPAPATAGTTPTTGS